MDCAQQTLAICHGQRCATASCDAVNGLAELCGRCVFVHACKFHYGIHSTLAQPAFTHVDAGKTCFGGKMDDVIK
ncbi:hypothetical protein D3C80_1493520 [compost metagenome]